jgi:hypothetical protein
MQSSTDSEACSSLDEKVESTSTEMRECPLAGGCLPTRERPPDTSLPEQMLQEKSRPATAINEAGSAVCHISRSAFENEGLGRSYRSHGGRRKRRLGRQLEPRSVGEKALAGACELDLDLEGPRCRYAPSARCD